MYAPSMRAGVRRTMNFSTCCLCASCAQSTMRCRYCAPTYAPHINAPSGPQLAGVQRTGRNFRYVEAPVRWSVATAAVVSARPHTQMYDLPIESDEPFSVSATTKATG
jgi:hypothetical protein